jgi:hypothetical protein
MPRMGIFLCGLPKYGDEISEEPEKVRKIFKGKKALLYLFQATDFILKENPGTPEYPKPEHMPVSFYLHTKEWFDGKTTTTGTGAYFFKEDQEPDLHLLQESATNKMMKIRGKKHYILAFEAEMCQGCYYPIKGENTSEEAGPYFGLPHCVDRSTVISEFCQMCKPDWSCTCCGGVAHIPTPENKNITEYLIHKKFIYCSDCGSSMEKQEKWRNEGKGSYVKETVSSYVEKKHLCDDAIALIQAKMGGKPQEPSTDITPFQMYCNIDELVDPGSPHFWPFGMSSLDYLKMKAEQEFNNPRSEDEGYLGVDVEYDDDWRDVEVTDDLVQEYSDSLEDVLSQYPTRDDLPSDINFEGKTMRILPAIHGFSCDSGQCQAIFQCGRSNPVTIPMYTSREGDLSGDVSDLTYGFERCIVCLSR